MLYIYYVCNNCSRSCTHFCDIFCDKHFCITIFSTVQLPHILLHFSWQTFFHYIFSAVQSPHIFITLLITYFVTFFIKDIFSLEFFFTVQSSTQENIIFCFVLVWFSLYFVVLFWQSGVKSQNTKLLQKRIYNEMWWKQYILCAKMQNTKLKNINLCTNAKHKIVRNEM